MNGAFQMKYCMGPNTAIFTKEIFWLRWDLNTGLPVEKPLYPLLHLHFKEGTICGRIYSHTKYHEGVVTKQCQFNKKRKGQVL